MVSKEDIEEQLESIDDTAEELRSLISKSEDYYLGELLIPSIEDDHRDLWVNEDGDDFIDEYDRPLDYLLIDELPPKKIENRKQVFDKHVALIEQIEATLKKYEEQTAELYKMARKYKYRMRS